jgi:hypothetical protein
LPKDKVGERRGEVIHITTKTAVVRKSKVGEGRGEVVQRTVIVFPYSEVCKRWVKFVPSYEGVEGGVQGEVCQGGKGGD